LEEVIEENCRDKLVEFLLILEHMIDDDTRSLAIAPREVFDHLDYSMMYIQKNISFQKTI
jgi:hypothetical protein